MRALTRWMLLGLVLTMPPAGVARTADDYEAEILKWRQAREDRLKSDTGWLTVAGLFWLEPGENTMGSASGSDIVLPASAPARVGVLTYDGQAATFKAAPGVTVTSGDEPVVARKLRDDFDENTDVLTVGRLRFFVIKRGDRHGVRLRDLDSTFRKEFTTLSWFPVDPAWRIEARFVTSETPHKIRIANIIGTVDEETSPGYAVWDHDGKEVRLEPIAEGDQLFFIFRDATSDDTSYPPGRYLYTPLPKDGKVVLDFNKAYTPPCAFTPFATCPLPPAENRLGFRIEAGEKNYTSHP